jgi:hypothetical protein
VANLAFFVIIRLYMNIRAHSDTMCIYVHLKTKIVKTTFPDGHISAITQIHPNKSSHIYFNYQQNNVHKGNQEIIDVRKGKQQQQQQHHVSFLASLLLLRW